jgi:hypothetical protein
MDQTVLFLDFDDVLCLNAPHGAYDVMLALRSIEKGESTLQDFSDLWVGLFGSEAKSHLRALNEEFKPLYVLSTSWIKTMDRDALVEVLTQTGLGFVVESFHPTWRTTDAQKEGQRADEIGGWLDRHPGFNDKWLVLDDTYSGTGLMHWPDSIQLAFVTLCQKYVGLTLVEYEILRTAFLARGAAERAEHG